MKKAFGNEFAVSNLGGVIHPNVMDTHKDKMSGISRDWATILVDWFESLEGLQQGRRDGIRTCLAEKVFSLRCVVELLKIFVRYQERLKETQLFCKFGS